MHFPLSCFFFQSSKKCYFLLFSLRKGWAGPRENQVSCLNLTEGLLCSFWLFQEWIKLLTSLLVQRSWNRGRVLHPHTELFPEYLLVWGDNDHAWNCSKYLQLSSTGRFKGEEPCATFQGEKWWKCCPAHSDLWVSAQDPAQHPQIPNGKDFCSSSSLGSSLGFFAQCELTSLTSTLCGFWMHRALKRSSVSIWCVT